MVHHHSQQASPRNLNIQRLDNLRPHSKGCCLICSAATAPDWSRCRFSGLYLCWRLLHILRRLDARMSVPQDRSNLHNRRNYGACDVSPVVAAWIHLIDRVVPSVDVGAPVRSTRGSTFRNCPVAGS